MKNKSINMDLIPKLRFPEFHTEWESCLLGSIAEFSKGKGISKSDISENGKLECIRYGELYTRYNEVIESVVSRTNLKAENLVLSAKNDVIIPASGETQIDIATASCVINAGIALSGDINIIKSDTNGIFLAYYLNNAKKIDIAKLSQGISVVHLYNSQLKLLKLNLPDTSEQQIIASFLSTIDKKIQQLTRKKELLEQYKKGVMKKIFGQEIRFKDVNGRDFPDWEENCFANIFTYLPTNSFSRNDLIYETGTVKNIHYGDIHTTFKMGFNIINENVPFINKEANFKIKDPNNFCKVGDIIIADASEDYNDIGKAIEILNTGDEKIVAGLHTFHVRDVYGLTVDGFKGYLLQSKTVRKQIKRFAQGISVLGISKKNIDKVKFLLPCKEEQKKIVSLLSNIDRKIEAIQTQFDKTKEFKKGLLQQMFV